MLKNHITEPEIHCIEDYNKLGEKTEKLINKKNDTIIDALLVSVNFDALLKFESEHTQFFDFTKEEEQNVKDYKYKLNYDFRKDKND